MAEDRTWPRPGDKLVHRFRKRRSHVEAMVISVDQASGRVGLEMDGREYPSLSAAASAVTGHETNGWIFWGLKKQGWRPKD